MKKLLTTAIALMALLAQAEVVITEVMADNGGKYATAAGEGDDPGPHPQEVNAEIEEHLLDLGLSIVVIDTVDREEPAYEIANPPPGCWGAGIKNATKVPGRLRIKTTAGVAYDSGEYVKKSSGMTLKIRGNTSALAAKKPYKIKLQKKADLLLRGDGEKYADSEWVLLASANSLNNVIGFAINDLLKLQWTPSYQYVNLVVNGTYRGVYLLCEGMNRNPSCRIDVADDGYLFELDAYWWNEDVYFKTPSCSMPLGYTFKYPDSDDITQEQVNLISNVMTYVEDAIEEADYESCIDVDSFAAWLLGHDILGTSDGGGSNIYFTKYDAGRETKVRMANLWDFDTICMCSNDWSAIHRGSYAHFSKLCASKNLAFNDQYRKKWHQLRRGLCGAVADTLDEMVASGLAQSLEKSWAQEASTFDRTRKSFAPLRQSMEAWFSDRVEWIDAHIDEMPHNPDSLVVVNEIMADNGGSLLTADGKAEDWIELYNPGETDADISGWRLCDSTTKKWSKWEELPEGTVIPAGGYLIVWADDFTGWTNGEVHVNLGFSKGGEEVALAIAEGEIVDSFAFGPQCTDVSFGRDPSDPEKLVYFTEPTPAAANGDAGREALVFTIGFDSNGGTPVASVTNDYDAAISAPADPTRTGYTFVGWYEAGAAEPFVFSKMPARDVALTAHWTANGYTVAFDANGGSGTMEDQIFLYDEPQPLDANLFAKGHCLFEGWTVRGDANNVVFADGEVVSNLTTEADGVVTLCAQWKLDGWEVISGAKVAIETGLIGYKATGLPKGLSYNKTTGKVTGAPSRAGDYEVVLTMTTKYGTKETVKVPVWVTEMPETAVGTFSGFVSVSNDTHGTFTLTTTAAGKLAAKVVTAAGTVTFSGTGWDSAETGVYRAALTTKKGEKLALTLDSTAAWDANQLSGEFTTSAVATYSVSAQRNAFGKTWHFSATGDAKTGWTFLHAKDSKAAALTVTLKADGSTSIAGALPNGKDAKGKDVAVKVSASGYANVGGLRVGAVLADFAPVLTVGGKRKVLSITTNLCFDRDSGIGEAKFVE